ncbi:MAG: IS3 family transposase, partial [Methylovulum sp.]
MKKQKDKAILDEIAKIIREFAGYGYRRVTKELKNKGFRINHKRVLRIMRKNNLTVKRKRRFKITTDSNHKFRIYPNLIKGLVLGRINQVWVADITYVRLPKGFVYLAVVLDAYSRRVIGWCLREDLTEELALRALKTAIASRTIVQGLIHHSDRGVQYASIAYTNLLRENNILISMSRKGNCYDNAKAESFFKTIKAEEI